MSSVVKKVKKVVKKAWDWVNNQVIKPVVNVVKNAFNDPIGTIAKVAAIATGNAWAIPLIDGATVAINGGDIGDALKAAAVSYVGGKVGAAVGDVAGEWAGDLVENEVAKDILKSSVGSGAGNASVALITGRDPIEAFISGGINGAVGAGLGYVDEALDGKFSALPEEAQNVIKAGITSALQGEDLTEEQIWNAVLTSKRVTETVGEFIGENTGWDLENPDDRKKISALTAGIQKTAAAAFGGGDVPDAIMSAITNYGQTEFKDWIDSSDIGKNFNVQIDKLSGKYSDVEEAAQAYEDLSEKHQGSISAYNKLADDLKARIAKGEDLQKIADADKAAYEKDKTEAAYNKAQKSQKAANDYATQLNKDYQSDYKPQMDNLSEQILKWQEEDLPALLQEYEKQNSELSDASQELTETLNPVYNKIEEQFVNAMEPDFDVNQYIAMNDLDVEPEDAYFHWLTQGKRDNLPVNTEKYNKAIGDAQSQYINAALLEAGIDPSTLSKDQADKVSKYFENELQGSRLTDFKEGGIYGRDENGNYREAIDLDAETLQDMIVDTSESYGGYVDALANVSFKKNFEDLSFDERRQIIEQAQKGNVTAGNNIGNPNNVSDADILSGKAVVKFNPQSGIEWSNLYETDPDVYFSAADNTRVYNAQVLQFLDPQTGTYYFATEHLTDAQAAFLRAKGNRVQGLKAGSEVVSSRILRTDAETNEVLGTPVGAVEIYLNNINDLQETNPLAWFGLTGRAIEAGLDLADSIIPEEIQNYIGDTWQNVKQYMGEAGDNVMDAIMADDTLRDSLAVVIGGGGELLNSFNDLLYIAGVNPDNTALGGLARNMIALSGEMESDAYKEAVQNIQAQFSKNRSDDPNAFQFEEGSWYGDAGNAILNVWDGFQEAPGYFLSEFVAKEIIQEIPVIAASIGTGGLAGMGVAAARKQGIEMAKDAAQTISRRAALTTAATLDMAEAIGGSAGQSFDEVYNELLKAGVGEEEAIEVAYEAALKGGLAGGITTAVTMGLLKGNDFEKIITNQFTKGTVKNAVNSLQDKIREGATVMVKEGVQEALEEGTVAALAASYILDYNPDYDVAGNIAQNATLGAIAGSGTAGSIYTGNAVANTIIKTNSSIQNVINDTTIPREQAIAELGKIMNEIGLDDNLVRTDLFAAIDPNNYTSTTEVTNLFRENGFYTPTVEDYTQFVGQKTDVPVKDQISTWIDERYFDTQEVIDAAKSEGLTITEEQAQEYVSQYKTPQEAKQALQDAVKKFDPMSTTFEEAKQMFADLGFTPTDAEIQKFVAGNAETDQKAAIETYIDPLFTTFDEAKQFMTDELGYKPSDDEVNQFIGQLKESEQFGKITEYVDPRMVTYDEALQAYRDMGFEDFSKQDVEALVGQYAEEELAGKAEDYLPIAQYNSLKRIVSEYEAAGVERDEAMQKAIEDVAADLGITKEELTNKIQETETKLSEQITGVEETLTEDISDLADQLGLTEEQLTQKIEEGDKEILDQIGTVEETLSEDIAGVSTQVEDVAALLGKPAGEVTQDDITLVEDLLKSQEDFLKTAAEGATFEYTPEQLQYDVTGDKQVTQEDLDILTQAKAGEQVSFAPDSKFAPTGIYGQIDQNQQLTTDLITEMQQNLLQDAYNKDKQSKFRDFMQMGQAGLFDPGTVTVSSGPAFNLQYLYDIGGQNIFATPQQASLFGSPYAEGGVVDGEDENDRLLRLIRGQ